MKRLIRNANIGLAVSVALLVVGFWPVHRSDTATTILGLVAFAVGMGLLIALNLRDERDPPRDQRRPPGP
jgi:hypothetical protein